MAYRPEPSAEELVKSYFDAEIQKKNTGAEELRGVGGGISEALKQAAMGLLEQIGNQYQPTEQIKSAADRLATSYAASRTPRPSVGPETGFLGFGGTRPPATAEEAIPPPPGPAAMVGQEALNIFPPYQTYVGAKRALQANEPRYLSQRVPGPLEPGQTRPIQVQPLGVPPPYERGFEMGGGATEAGIGAAMTEAMMSPFRPSGPRAVDLNARPIRGPGQPWWINEALPETGTPSRLPPERGLPNGLAPEPGVPGALGAGAAEGAPGAPPRPRPPGGGAGKAAGGSFKFTVRLPNDQWVEFSLDALTDQEALTRARAAMPPNMRDFFDSQRVEVLKRGEATGQKGIYDVSSNHPGFEQAQKARATGQAKNEAAWDTWQESVNRYARTGRGPQPGPPPPGPRPRYRQAEPSGAAPPSPKPPPEAPSGARAGAKTKKQGPPKAEARPPRQRPQEAARPQAKAQPQAAPEETPIQRTYRENRDRLRKEFQDVHGYPAPDYAAPSDLEAMIRQERAKTAEKAPTQAPKAPTTAGPGQPAGPPAQAKPAEGPKAQPPTIKPVVVDVFQGAGRKERGSVYSHPEAGPVVGKGRYFATTEAQAKTYGPEIRRYQVNLSNPLVISNDSEWRALTKSSGVSYPNYSAGGSAGKVEGVKADAERVRAEILRRGHDGLVVNVPESEIEGKTLQKMFGHSQVINFTGKATEHPAPATAEKPRSAARPAETAAAAEKPQPPSIAKIMKETEAARKVKPSRGIEGVLAAAEKEAYRRAEVQKKDAPGVVTKGREAKVKTAARDYGVRYEEVPLEALIPSHDPMIFRKAKEYPFEQQRNYSASEAEQLKVLDMAKRFDPEQVLTDTPSPADGPPIVSAEGHVLGGNGRTMALMRRLDQDPAYLAEWQRAVEAARSKFGLPDRRKTDTPTMIVRRMAEPLTMEEQRASTKDLNEGKQKEVDPTDLAVSRARNISPATIDWFAEQLGGAGEGATIRSLLTTDRQFLENVMKRFAEERVTNSSELPRFMDEKTGGLNEAGLRMVEETILGSVVRSSKLLRMMPTNIKAMFSTALSALARIEAHDPDWNIRSTLIDALAVYQEAERAGKTVDMIVQPQLEANPFLEAVSGNKLIMELARWIEENANRPNALRTALKKYEGAFQDARGGQAPIGFIDQLLAPDAFNKAFGTKISKEDFGKSHEGVYLYDITGAAMKGMEQLKEKLSGKGKEFLDWLLTPSDIRIRRTTETAEEMIEKTLRQKTGDSARRGFASAVESFLNVAILDRPLSKYPAFREELSRYTVRTTNAAAAAVEAFAKVMEPVRYKDVARRKKRSMKEVDELFVPLAKAIYLRDVWARAKVGIPPPEFAELQYKGKSAEFIVKDLERRAKRAEEETHPDALDTRERLYGMMTDLRKQQVERGKLSEHDRIGRYYWPHLFDYSRTIDHLHLSPATPRVIKEAVRKYTRKAKGTLVQHEPNFFISGMQHYLQVTMDNLLDDFAHEVGRTWDISLKIIEHAENLKDIRIPEGYGVYQVRRTRYGWKAQTYAEFKLLMELQRDPDLGEPIHTMEDIRALNAIHTGHDRLAYVLPKAIIAKLERFRLPRSKWDEFASNWRGVVGRWKGAILAMLGSPYQMGNLLGDWENIVKLPGFDRLKLGPVKVPIPSGVASFGKLPQAVVDALQMAYGEPTKPEVFERHGPIARTVLELMAGRKTTPTARAGYDLGISQQTYGSAELGDLRKHPSLDVFVKPKRGIVGKAAMSPFEAIDRAFDIQRFVSIARESIPRQQMVLYLLSKYFTPERARSVVARELVDYQNVPEMNKVMRDTGLFPFATFFYQNFPNWVRSISGHTLGAKSELGKEAGGAGGAHIPPQEPPQGEPGGGFFGAPDFVPPELERLKSRGEVSRMGLRNFAITFGVPMLAWWYWNSVKNKELDDQVDPWTKLTMTYLIVGETSDGRPIMVAWKSAMGAALQFAGATNPIERAQRIVAASDEGKGGGAVQRQAYESIMGPSASVGSMLGPTEEVVKTLAEASFDRYQELRSEDPKIDEKVQRLFKAFMRNNVPFVNQWRGITRQDLESEPAWLPLFLSPSPLSPLLKVPFSADELQRRKNRATTGPVIKTGNSGSRAVIKQR